MFFTPREARVVYVLPVRRVRAHIPLPRPVRLAVGHPVAAQKAQRDRLEGPLPPVPDRQAGQPPGRGERDAVHVPEGGGHPLPLARRQHPITMARHRGRGRIASGHPWSAGCAETCLSGAEGGPGKRPGSNPGAAPRSDPYTKLHGPAKWTYYHLYVILDIHSRYVTGWMLATRESAALAEKLIAATCAKQGISRGQLTIHAGRGSSMTSKPVAFL